MKLRIYQVDAFTNKVFAGNPAAVCPLEKWLSDELMQNIAMENNLPETAFYVKEGDKYHIRWFTPTVEVDLCGHATLAAAFVLFNHEGHEGDVIKFYSHRSGPLSVAKTGSLLTLSFPTDIVEQAEVTDELWKGLGEKPQQAFKGKTDYMLVFDNESQIKAMKPNFGLIAQIDARGVIVTAEGDEADFVCRFFGPQTGINEDPATGSAYTTQAPYWANRLGKKELTAIQLSERGANIRCKHLNERVEISGEAKLYLKGEIYIE